MSDSFAVLAAAGKNTRSATEREEARLTKGVELRRRHDATVLHCYWTALHLTTHDYKTAPKRRNAVVRGSHHLVRYSRRHVERLSPHPFQPSRREKGMERKDCVWQRDHCELALVNHLLLLRCEGCRFQDPVTLGDL
jgi:hypothetical protein